MQVIRLPKLMVIEIPIVTANDYKINGQGDTGFISGIVTEKGVPVSRRVFCYHRLTGRLVANTVSGADGYYRLNRLVSGVKYYVTSLDENNDNTQYNAVTQDLVVASEVTV